MEWSATEVAEYNTRFMTGIVRLIEEAEALKPWWMQGRPTGSQTITPGQLEALMKLTFLPVKHQDAGNSQGGTSETVPAATKVRGMLDSVYALNREGKIDDGIELVIEKIDDWMCADEFLMCDLAMKMVDTGSLQEDLVFSFVTATFAGKGEMNYRADFIARARERIAALRGPGFATELLAPYE